MTTLAPADYRCAADDLLGIRRCHDRFGFVVVADVIDQAELTMLRSAVTRIGRERGYDGSQDLTMHAFMEYCPEMLQLLDNTTLMDIHQLFAGSPDMTLSRSAAILRRPGSEGCAWHTDWNFSLQAGQSANEVLNVTEKPSTWLYLNGCAPERGGLAVIAGSHRMDWPGPDGFVFTEHRQSFHPVGGWGDRDPMQVPGMVPIHAEPCDLIIFAARTYHAAFPNTSDDIRLSCAFGFRPGRRPMQVPWEQPASSRAFVAGIPERYAGYVAAYCGYEC